MKYEWKKVEKSFYIPKNQPELVRVPSFGFYSIHGRGNPNDDFFSDYIAVLYAVSYAVKMSPKHGLAPEHYHDYTVYPLEGIWEIEPDHQSQHGEAIDKNHLVFNLMIRQPDFVSEEFAYRMIERTKQKKSLPLLDQVRFERMEEGNCVQMLHLGSYEREPESFGQMEQFMEQQQLRRRDHSHREIYLSDPRRVVPEKLKTVLRFAVEER